MGLFNIFDKETCSVCGQETGRLFGKHKIVDGFICNDCNAKLSPYFNQRATSSLERIQQHLAYREANQAEVQAFNVTRTISGEKMLMLDEDAQKFVVASRGSDWRTKNPDVIGFSQVTGCDIDVSESRSEEKYRDSEGNYTSYNPPRYNYDYDFYVTINLNHEWFSSIKIKVNDHDVPDRYSGEYRAAEGKANEIKSLLTSARQEARDTAAAAAEAAKPKGPVICPYCGATTTPTATNCCEYCGGPVS